MFGYGGAFLTFVGPKEGKNLIAVDAEFAQKGGGHWLLATNLEPTVLGVKLPAPGLCPLDEIRGFHKAFSHG